MFSDVVEAGARIAEAGAPAGEGTRGARGTLESTAPILLEARHRSVLLYDDRAPNQGYQHAGQAALVSLRTGDVQLTPPLRWPVAVNGALPGWLRRPVAYRAAGNRVFSRGVTRRRGVGTSHNGFTDFIDLDAQWKAPVRSSCVLRLGDTLAGAGADLGSPLDLQDIGSARGTLAELVSAMAARGLDIRSFTYGPAVVGSPEEWLRDKLGQCRQTLVWLAGAGAGDTVVVGARVGPVRNGLGVVRQEVSVAMLRRVLAAADEDRVVVVVDAPGAGGFSALEELPNVSVPAGPSGVVPGSWRPGGVPSLRRTWQLAYGITSVLRQRPADLVVNGRRCAAGLPLLVAAALDTTACRPVTITPLPGGGSSGTPLPTPTDPVLASEAADLSVGISLSKRAPDVEDVVTYTVSVTNAGPRPAGGVRVRITLPPDTSPVGASTSDYDPATGIWDLGSVGAGAVRILKLDASIGAVPGPQAAVAEVIASDRQDPDSVPGNGATEDDRATAVHTIRSADVSVEAFCFSLVSPSAGCGVTLRNSGPDPARGLVVAIAPLPIEVPELGPVDVGTYDAGTRRWSVPELGAGEVAVLTWQGFMSGSLAMWAEVVGSTRYDPDSTPGNGAAAGEDDYSASG